MRPSNIILLIFVAWIGPVRGAPLPSDFSGAEVYAQHCARCHSTAVGGAPRPGHNEDWLARLSAGRADLLLSVLKGKGGMPPKGGNASISVGEANAALDFMLTAPPGKQYGSIK